MEKKGRRGLWHDLAFFVVTLGGSVAVCQLLSGFFQDNNPFAVPVFILAVALISRYTNGYRYGIAASVVGVFCVNVIFTYPYWEFNLAIAGYPLTFAVMLLVSLMIGTLTTRVKRQEKLRYEAEAEKMRANLLRAVSHDLRTPLSSILGASSTLLAHENLSKAQHDELLQEIGKDAQWLVRAMENILSVTKFSGGTVVLKKTDEVVEEIVGSAIVKFRRSHPALPVTVERPQEILLVPMDATLIAQVLANLFENVAIHGKRATEIRLRIAAEPDRVCFSVADNGVGIPTQKLPSLFDGTGAMGGDGADGRRSMGIGLSVCATIIKAHGGRMSAENNPQGGATLRFELPLEGESNEQSPTR